MRNPNIIDVPFNELRVGIELTSPVSQRTGYRYYGWITELKPADENNPDRIECIFPEIALALEVTCREDDVLLGPGLTGRQNRP